MSEMMLSKVVRVWWHQLKNLTENIHRGKNCLPDTKGYPTPLGQGKSKVQLQHFHLPTENFDQRTVQKVHFQNQLKASYI